ncbi:MAG: hypothetical protein WD579_01395 [Candidatus Paceibacterota bacterium]
MDTKKNIFERYKDEYIRADKVWKGKILDYITDVTRMHRKACIRRFGEIQRDDGTKQESRGRLHNRIYL